MTFRLTLLLVAIGVVGTCFGAPTEVAAPAQAVPDPMLLLPENSRHIFLPAPRVWTAKTDYLQPQGGNAGFIVLQAPAKPDLKTDWRQISYFDDPQEKDANQFRKILRFRPSGQLALEADRTSTQQFDRTFYRDGSIASYEFLSGVKRVAGYSVSPDRKIIMHFAQGKGDLIQWHEAKGAYIHTWYSHGDPYLIKTYEQEQCIRTELNIPQIGELVVTGEEEKLFLFSLHENWIKQPNKPISAQVNYYYINGKDGSLGKYDFPDDEIKKRIREVSPHRVSRPRPPPSPELLQQLEADYLSRRAGFLSQYEAVLRDAGQSWQSLGLESVLTPPK